jgi:hypothetical protein
MRQVAPLVVATLVAIGAALSPAFLSPEFVRPSHKDALDIIEAAADYNLLISNAEAGGQSVPLLPESAKPDHIKFIETKACGAVEATEDCVILDVNLGENAGRLLVASWHDAGVNLESHQGINADNPLPKIIDIRRLQSPSAEKLARLQIAASRQKVDFIAPSGLDANEARSRIMLRGDTPERHLRIYSAPWVADDIAFMEVGLICGDLCGRGENYALRKVSGKWRVIAVQPSWVS